VSIGQETPSYIKVRGRKQDTDVCAVFRTRKEALADLRQNYYKAGFVVRKGTLSVVYKEPR
jgi:hypothetical protein